MSDAESSRPRGHQSALADHPDVREVISVFIGRLPGHVQRLRALLEAGDAAELRRLAHQLRGAGRSYGFEPITRYAEVIDETILAGKPIMQVRPAVEQLIEYLQDIEGYRAG